MLAELHDGPAGGHYVGDTTAHKIIRVVFYWPTLFKDAHAYVRKCQQCQKFANRDIRPSAPLQSVTLEEKFQQWGLDVIGEILPHSSKQHRYILTGTDYFTRWVEVVPLRQVNDQEVIAFITQCIMIRFCVPTSLVFDNATYFLSFKLYDFSLENGIILKHSANYYPQGNGLAESTNKNLIRIIKNTLLSQQRNWHRALHNALWAYRFTP